MKEEATQYLLLYVSDEERTLCILYNNGEGITEHTTVHYAVLRHYSIEYGTDPQQGKEK